MSGNVKIDFRLSAEVNGESFEMNGTGVGNPVEGTCTLNLAASPRFPLGFDPVSCPSICSHPTSSFFSRPVVEGNSFAQVTGLAYEVKPARHGLVYDSKGNEVLNLWVSGSVRLENGILVSEHKMVGTSKLPPLAKNVTPFDDYFIPSRAGEATGLVRFKLLSLEGEELDGMTIIPYRWSSGQKLESLLARRVEDIQVEWNGGREVSAYYRTAIRPLAAQSATELLITLPAGLGDPAELLQMAQLSRE